jgi:hypothetical protein
MKSKMTYTKPGVSLIVALAVTYIYYQHTSVNAIKSGESAKSSFDVKHAIVFFLSFSVVYVVYSSMECENYEEAMFKNMDRGEPDF